MTNIVNFSRPKNYKKKILFLGYNKTETCIIDILIKKNCYVDFTKDKYDGSGNYELLISFGYKHILTKNVLKRIGCPAINLHISYLPFNRGAHPNFWSFYDNTPSGVTIHLIDEGVDTGSIIYQKYVDFDRNEKTFSQTYKRLINEIETLFKEKINFIINDKWNANPQKGLGTFHFTRDLPKEFSGWDSNVIYEVKRLQKKETKYENK